MKRQFIAAVFLGFFLVIGSFGVPVDPNTKILYKTEQLPSGGWQYTYNVNNISLFVPIEEFTIWFDFGLYDNLAVETADPLASRWDEIVWQPDDVLKDAGAYDALTLGSGVGIGKTVGGFTVSFDWLGEGEPGKQWYEIVEPVTFETIDSGWTIPEPATIFLLGLGAVALWKKWKASCIKL